MLRFSDIHTHTPGRPDSVLSISANDVEQVLSANSSGKSEQYYSLQLHPWHVKGTEDIDAFVKKARELADDPYFVAIGECGLDALCDTPLSIQREAFKAALNVADELGKPVIIHCVKLWAELTALTRRHQSQLIIHGFRKGPELARQLLDAGFSLSLGQRYNEEVIRMIPPEKLFRETDDSFNT